MGSGTFRAGKFNLILSIRHNASAARVDEWRASFERASELLFDATDGQHQFGDIYVCNNSTGGRNADAWLLQPDGRSHSAVDALGNETAHMTLYGDERFKPFIVIHEFGHYGYGLRDEYIGPLGMAECIGGTTADACIMENGWRDGDRFGNDATGGALVLGRVSEFCVASNHDPDGDTYQDDVHGESCWETMEDDYPDLTLPAELPVAAAPAGADPINWTVLAPEQRFVLVVDRSGSMTGNKLTEAKYGADWWADHAVDGDLLGVVSYSDTVTPDYALQTISGDPDRTAAQLAIGSISAGGWTSIGGGLREALNQILGAGARAATQVVVLLTDGLHNSGESPSSVLPDLVDNGVRVYTIGIGPSIDSVLLEDIASTTGGTFYRIDPALSVADQEFEIRLALQEISGIARDNGGLVTTMPERMEEGATLEYKAFIEPGSEMATFAISWKNREDLLYLELESPDGQYFTLGPAAGGVRPIYSDRPYMGFQVQKPVPGEWRLIVKSEKVAEVAEFRTFVFSQNSHIDGGLISPWRQYKPGDIIPLQLQVYFNAAITGLKVSGTALLPGGERVPLEFSDDGNKELGDMVPGDGIYSTLFRAPRTQGMYTFEVIAESDGETVAYTEVGERLLKGDKYKYDPIPPFRRRFMLTVAVGEEPCKRVDIEPNSGQPGDGIEVTLKGRLTHFRPDSTRANFGEGIRVEGVKVLDKETAVVPIIIDKEAQPGPRDVTVTTPIYKETIEVEGGFQVVRRKSS
jgi:hypothetical protein